MLFDNSELSLICRRTASRVFERPNQKGVNVTPQEKKNRGSPLKGRPLAMEKLTIRAIKHCTREA